MSKPFALELTIQASSGAMGSIGAPKMFGRICMFHAPGSSFSDAVVSLIGRDERTDTWRSYQQSVTSEAALDVATQIDALGMPGRTPLVTQVFDTSDSWTNLVLWVKKGEQAISFEIGMLCSGFEGPDAHALRRLLQTLCSLSGYDGFDRSVVGSAVVPPPAEVPSSSAVWGTPRFCCMCAHDLGEGGYPDGRDVACPSSTCQRVLPQPHSTCVQAACGHFAPLGSTFCWVCGVGVTAS